MAAKRAAIMANIVAAQANAAAVNAAEEAPLDPSKFGTHSTITCDGCSTYPVVGYRWKCNVCKNHDLCDACCKYLVLAAMRSEVLRSK